MAGETYVIQTGADKHFWPQCLAGQFVALTLDKPYFDFWEAGDREGFAALMKSKAEKDANDATVKGNATAWFNYALKIRESVDDIFIIRIGNDVWWATTKDEAWFPVEHEYQGETVVAICKPIDKWSRFSTTGQPLQWPVVHVKAQNYLTPQPALFRIANGEMLDYIDALLHGHDLAPWHGKPSWKLKQGDHGVATNLDATTIAVTALWYSMKETTSKANGQLEIHVKSMKDKKIIGTEQAMRAHLADLWKTQNGRCKISGISMHVPTQEGAKADLMVSPDRIDSNGHYEAGNIQLVCRFINYWKCAAENGKFLDLLDLVIESRQEMAAMTAE